MRYPEFRNVEAIRDAVTASGSHFFDPDTMRSFGSRVLDDLGARCAFITSERDTRGPAEYRAWEGRRRYTVRIATVDPSTSRRAYIDGRGWVDVEGVHLEEFGEFGEYGDPRAARRALKRCAEEIRSYRAGYERGHSSGTWVETSDVETARAILSGYEDGDPEVMDMVPAPLSGEWAEESIPELSDATGVDLEDEDLAAIYEEAFSEGFWEEVLRAVRYALEGELPAPLSFS